MKNKHICDVLRRNMHILQCPICTGKMSLCDTHLKCTKGHSFDLSRRGYVNLLNHPVSSSYCKSLFQSRKATAQSGFFDPLSKALVSEITRLFTIKQSISILDAGCGEGSILSQILNLMDEKYEDISSIGIDISKDGIMMAGRQYPGTLWMVADLANFPIADNSTDIILNILSPANYNQFKRILKRNGIIIKVIPGKKHLRELRELLLKGKTCYNYSNKRVISLFEQNFKEIESIQIIETIPIEKENVSDLINMTPLMWHLGECEKESIREIDEVTLDLHVLTGRGSHFIY